MNLGLVGEDKIHAEIVEWARKNERLEPRLSLLFHCPNGGARSAMTGMKMKALGVRRGVPDLGLPVAKYYTTSEGLTQFHGLWLEIKAPGGRQSPEQKLWMEALRAQGCKVEVVYTVEEGIAIIKSYLGMA